MNGTLQICLIWLLIGVWIAAARMLSMSPHGIDRCMPMPYTVCMIFNDNRTHLSLPFPNPAKPEPKR